MKREIGYDLTGWRDLAVLREEGETRTVSGGLGASVVETNRSGTTSRAREAAFVGGVQGLLAPHGRGGGWGQGIGALERRVPVREVLAAGSGEETNGLRFRAALRGLVDPRRATVALAISDDGSVDEAARDWHLTELRRAGARAALLVWRPVALALDVLARGGVAAGMRLVVVTHDARGLTVQSLDLVEEDGLVAPERCRTGRSWAWDGGLATRRDAVAAAMVRSAGRAAALIATTGLPIAATIGEADAQPELVRLDGGDWKVLDPAPAPGLPDLPEGFLAAIDVADVLAVDTPLSGKARGELLERLGGHAVDPDPGAVARGAAEAARRYASGEPVFFDFLPQISTVVTGLRGAESFDLIPETARLRAGQLYRSARPARLRLLAGAERIVVYLRKEGAGAPRRVEVPLPMPTATEMEVAVSVEQMPAAGRAKVMLESSGLTRPLIANWESAEILDTSWEDVIVGASAKAPTIPVRMVLPCGIDAWGGRRGDDGLLALLRDYAAGRRPSWEDAQSRLSVKVDGRHAVGSDGALPTDLDSHVVRTFDALTEEAVEAVARRLDGRDRERSNEALKFLTWQFRRCPQTIVPELVSALRAGRGRHPFYWIGGNAAGLWQGIGRTATDPADQRAAFDLLRELPNRDWKKDQIACAAFLLSRTDSAPRLLRPEEMERIGRLVATRIEDRVQEKDFGPRFMYLPFLFVGLLRCRLEDPWALVAGQDEVADRLLSAAEAACAAMERQVGMAARRQLLEDACEELRGQGRNPDLLAALSREAR